MRTIKRYANRKLYDTETSRYVTLEDVADLIRTGEEIGVIDNKTGKDITRETMAQIILRMEKTEEGVPGTTALRDFILRNTESMRGAFSRSVSAGKGFVSHVEDQVTGLIKRLADKGVVTHDEARNLIQSMVQRAGQRADRLESKLDERVTAALTKLNIPTTAELSEIRATLEQIARKIENAARRQPAPPPSSPAGESENESQG